MNMKKYIVRLTLTLLAGLCFGMSSSYAGYQILACNTTDPRTGTRVDGYESWPVEITIEGNAFKSCYSSGVNSRDGITGTDVQFGTDANSFFFKGKYFELTLPFAAEDSIHDINFGRIEYRLGHFVGASGEKNLDLHVICVSKELSELLDATNDSERLNAVKKMPHKSA